MYCRQTIGIVLGTAALASALTLLVQRVRAAGIPVKGTLTYTGALANPDGTPVTAPSKQIGLFAYDAQTGGTIVQDCTVMSSTVNLTGGQFQIQLPDACSAQIKVAPDLWLEVQVDGTSLGRIKLGAVPYAVEAGHAVSADLAANATHAALAADANGLHVASDGDAQAFISTNHDSANDFSYLFLDKGRGTGAAPTSVVDGDEIYRIYGRAYDAGTMRNATVIESVVEGGPAATGVPGALWFGTSDGQSGEAAERMRITSGGNVVIGRPYASQKFEVWTSASASPKGVIVGAPDSHYMILAPSAGQGSWNGMTQAGDTAIMFSGGAKGTGAFVIAPWADATTGIRIDGTTGNVGIGTATPAYRLDVNGVIRATNVSATSDARLKSNIRTLEHPLEDLQQLRGVRFNWNSDGKASVGVIAQEIERVYPELVFTASDGMKSVDYDKLAAVLIESSKVLVEKTSSLAAQNTVLQQENEELRARLELMERKLNRLLGE